MQLNLTAKAQLAFNQPMLSSEQFSLDGLDQVSAFAAGTFNVDQGATLRGELARPAAFAQDGWSATLTPYLFASGGRGEIFLPTAVEQAWLNAAAFGAGLRIAGDVANGTASPTVGVEVGRRFSNVVGERAGWRGNLAVSVRF
jgi:hemolysin activation/secretion protein